MRVRLLAASVLLTSAMVSRLATLPAVANEAPANCPCNCPDKQKAGRHVDVKPAQRRVVHHAPRHYADVSYYSYRSAAPVYQREWHGQWHAAPDDAYLPGPAIAYYGSSRGYEPEGLRVDDRSLSGGVGSGGEGGDGGGYGQAHFGSGGGVENGPTYNGYGQSFQYNPGQAGPFQPRLMGGFAPRK